MALKEFHIPNKMGINKKNICTNDIDKTKKELRLALKRFITSHKDKKKISKRDPTLIEFEKYCIIQFIKYLDYVHHNRTDDCSAIVTTNKKDIEEEILEFLNKIYKGHLNLLSKTTIRKRLNYLTENFYLTFETRKDYDDMGNENKSDCYSCRFNKTKALKYMSGRYTEGIYTTTDFCIKLITTDKEKIKNIEEAIHTIYADEIIEIYTYLPKGNKINPNNHYSHIRIIAKSDSSIYKDLENAIIKKRTN